MKCGLIPKDHLTVSGDGTAVHTHACPRGHKYSCNRKPSFRKYGNRYSGYGRAAKTQPEWDIRLYTEVPRGTDAYKKINQRTATERINNRILNDYGLHRMFIHTKEHYSFMAAMIGICLHLDARYNQLLMAA